jgi:hypothetical protein
MLSSVVFSCACLASTAVVDNPAEGAAPPGLTKGVHQQWDGEECGGNNQHKGENQGKEHDLHRGMGEEIKLEWLRLAGHISLACN